MANQPRIRVLIVDDSAIVRKVLTDIVAAEPDLEVVGTAPDPYVARDKILALEPDVLTLDIEMPRMDGLTFLEKIMRHRPMPVVVISSLGHSETALEALGRGAVEVLQKPGGPYSVGDLRYDLPRRIRAAAASRRHTWHEPAASGKCETPMPSSGLNSYYDIIAVGASTGGVTAIETLIRALPANIPGIVVTQHIPAGFSRSFADRLNSLCALVVREAEDGDRVEPGTVLVAPGNLHLSVQRVGQHYHTVVRDGPRVCFQRPSVDVLFHSVAAAGSRGLGVILTGMGSDGADGLLQMRKRGAFTIAQDAASCVVYGMPREAVAVGAVRQVLPLERISSAILNRLSTQPAAETATKSLRGMP